MEKERFQQKKLSLREISSSLALVAMKEMETNGNTTIKCPECDEIIIVEETKFDMYIYCPCGFVSKHLFY